MAIDEALRLYDVFPLAVQVNVWPVGNDFRKMKDATDRKVTTHLRDNALALGGPQVTRPSGATFVVAIGGNAIDPAKESCPALSTYGHCTIYDRRPLMCRAVPFNPELDPRLSIRIFRQAHQHNCDWKSTAPVLMRGGSIADPQYAADYAAAREAQRRDSELLCLLRQHDGDGFGELVEQAFSHTYEARLPFSVLFEMMRGLDSLGHLPARYVLPSPKDFYAAQIEVLHRFANPGSGRSLVARDKFRTVATAYEHATS
jgi:Fe-S-cluster containining protein